VAAPPKTCKTIVRRWIHKARPKFLLDDVVHEVDANTTGSANGQPRRRTMLFRMRSIVA
jgi:hypothetical protein